MQDMFLKPFTVVTIFGENILHIILEANSKRDIALNSNMDVSLL